MPRPATRAGRPGRTRARTQPNLARVVGWHTRPDADEADHGALLLGDEHRPVPLGAAREHEVEVRVRDGAALRQRGLEPALDVLSSAKQSRTAARSRAGS